MITLDQAEGVLRNHTPEVTSEWCECCGNTYEWSCTGCPDTWDTRSWPSGHGYTEHLKQLIFEITSAAG